MPDNCIATHSSYTCPYPVSCMSCLMLHCLNTQLNLFDYSKRNESNRSLPLLSHHLPISHNFDDSSLSLSTVCGDLSLPYKWNPFHSSRSVMKAVKSRSCMDSRARPSRNARASKRPQRKENACSKEQLFPANFHVLKTMHSGIVIDISIICKIKHYQQSEKPLIMQYRKPGE